MKANIYDTFISFLIYLILKTKIQVFYTKGKNKVDPILYFTN